MRVIIILSLILISLSGIAGGLDSSLIKSINCSRFPNSMFEIQKININLHISNDKSVQSKTNGWITLVAGIGFTAVGILMERDRVKSNIPDGWFGYSKSKRMFYDYSIMTIGVSLSITGGIMISR